MRPATYRQTDRQTYRQIEWPTLFLLVATYAVWAGGTLLWAHSGVLSLVLTILAIAQSSSLQHEVLHGHPFRSKALNEALVLPALTLCMPYQRFRDLHLQHHHDPTLTDPYDDPESNYFDPAVWDGLPRWRQRLLAANNTLLGRVTIGSAIGTYAYLRAEWALVRAGDRAVIRAWALNFAGLVPVLIWLHWAGMPIWAYVFAAYNGQSLIRIRSFLEHRAHETPRARTVIVEGQGLLALLFLNNNLHVVHHMHPTVPWYELPRLYAERRKHYLQHNDAYVYKGYGEVFRRHFLRAKDPVPHPLWRAGD